MIKLSVYLHFTNRVSECNKILLHKIPLSRFNLVRRVGTDRKVYHVLFEWVGVGRTIKVSVRKIRKPVIISILIFFDIAIAKEYCFVFIAKTYVTSRPFFTPFQTMLVSVLIYFRSHYLRCP